MSRSSASGDVVQPMSPVVTALDCPVHPAYFAALMPPTRRPMIASSGRVCDPGAISRFDQLAVLLGGEELGLAFHWIGPVSATLAARLRAANVKVSNPCEDAERAATLSTAWVFVALGEGTGSARCVAEAMAAGLPCVATDIPVHRDLVRHGESGYLCRQAGELIDRVAQLADSRHLRRRMGRAARRLAQLRFGKTVLRPTTVANSPGHWPAAACPEGLPAISIVVPTRNRAHTLRVVAHSFFAQELVNEVVFVSDAGDDDSETVLTDMARTYPEVRSLFLRNERRLGASESRNVGVRACSNEFVLFCDDDEYLEPGYARTCLNKLQRLHAAAVSGRRVYMQPGETTGEALHRFGTGLRDTAPFHPVICEYVNGARFAGDRQQPITNAVILTRRELLLRYPFDDAYRRGNGYREETDYQLNLFVHGYDLWVTNECHSLHLPLSQVRTGGQRSPVWRRIYWSIRYTNHLFRKYYAAYAARLRLRTPRTLAQAAFAAFVLYRELLRPPLHALVMVWMRRGARVAGQRRPAE